MNLINGIGLFQSVAAVSGAVAVTWDATKSPDWTLSGASLVGTHTGNAGGFWSSLWGSAARNPVTASSSYTATLTTMTGGSFEGLVGLNTSVAPSGGAPGLGGDTEGLSYNPSSGAISFNGGPLVTGLATAAQGDAIKWTIVPNTSFDLYKNGSLLHSTTFATLAAAAGGPPNCTVNPVFPIVTDGNTITGTVATGAFGSW